VTPAHTIRTTLVATIVATLTLGVFAVVYRGPLGVRTAATPAGDHSHSRSLQSVLTGRLATATLQSRSTKVSEGAPTRLFSPCRHNQHRQRLVTVDIKRQHAWACSGSRVLLSTPVTTGRSEPGDKTPRGSFVVEARVANTTLRPANGNAVHVDYWIPFRQNIWGFHDAPWQTLPFGSSRYRTEGSLGCVHVPSGAMRQLFSFVQPGTTVRIR
jgi:lipoprotein-anchoring transpeptidase ErfK/SrfK